MSLENMLTEMMTKKNKYRNNCEHLVLVVNSPIEMGFCSYGVKPRGVSIILECSKDCGHYCLWVP